MCKREIAMEEMEDEMQSFLKVLTIVILCLCYCYYIASRIPKGLLRLLSLLPIIYIFLIVPLNLSSLLFRAPTSFIIVWLANFKLLQFSFNQGPLALSPNISHFISATFLPLKHKLPPPSKPTKNSTNPPHQSTSHIEKPQENHFFLTSILLLLKVLVLGIMTVWAYYRRENMHHDLILVFSCFEIYVGIELTLAITAAPTRVILGFEIEPQFNKPYLCTSLQDFWGKRWNLTVSGALRSTVYDPLRHFANRFLGPTHGTQIARWLTFLVSGLMHELIYYYLLLVPPTWEITWFFVLQGTCTVVEVAAKKKMLRRGWRLPPVVSGPLVMAFIAVTAKWLFFPQMIRNGMYRNSIEERKYLVDFIKSKLQSHR